MQLHASGEAPLARINLLYIGPLDAQHRVGALAGAFIAALEREPRLHLLVVGDGPERRALRAQLGGAVTFLTGFARVDLEELPVHADLLVCPSTGPDAAATIIAAQRSGLPVLAVDGGEAAALIENGRSGFLVPDDQAALSDAIRWLSRRATLRERLATGGLLAAGARHSSGRERIMSA